MAADDEGFNEWWAKYEDLSLEALEVLGRDPGLRAVARQAWRGAMKRILAAADKST